MSKAGKRLIKAAKQIAAIARGDKPIRKAQDMRQDTAIGAAMKKAGVDPRIVALDRALALFRNTEGSFRALFERACAAYDMTVAEGLRCLAAVDELPGEGLSRRVASSDHLPAAPARQPHGDGEGHPVDAANSGRSPSAPPSPTDRGGEGHFSDAREGPKGDALPAREHTRAKRGLDAIAKSQGPAAQTLGWLALASVPSGPRAADIRLCDLVGLQKRQVTEMGTHGKWAVVVGCLLHACEQRNLSLNSEVKVFDALPGDVIRAISSVTESETLVPMAVGWAKGFISAAQAQIGGVSNAS